MVLNSEAIQNKLWIHSDMMGYGLTVRTLESIPLILCVKISYVDEDRCRQYLPEALVLNIPFSSVSFKSKLATKKQKNKPKRNDT